MDNTEITYADTFNARHLSAAEVARQFIAPAQYYQLHGLNHSVICGPRGSGKTTLLKMLQRDALRAWDEENAQKLQPRIKYIGIFVPADVRWARQLESVVKGIKSAEAQLRVYEIAFGSSVLLALTETLNQVWRIDLACKNSRTGGERKTEATLVQKLGELWSLPVKIPSISSLMHGLRLRQTRIPGISAKLKEENQLSDLQQEYPYIFSSWLEDLVAGIATINECLDVPDQRWALLLDELEIVPPPLLEKITSCLRSTYPNLIFKLALSPTGVDLFSKLETSDPSAGNDFQLIPLWYNEREDLRVFAEQLLCHALNIRGIDISCERLESELGRSRAPESDDEANAKASGSRDDRTKYFGELYSSDLSFAKFVDDSTIDLNNLHGSDNGPLIRKIAPLVLFRNRYLKGWTAENGAKRRPGRIGHEPYTGYPNILDLTEGNPRWILILADELATGRSKKNKELSDISVQTSAIDSFRSRYAAMLKVYPINPSGQRQIPTLYAFLEALANSNIGRLYYKAFTSDPALSFVIDAQAEKDYGLFIRTCIHLGALILMDSEPSKKNALPSNLASLAGQRARLCYRLAPEFFLPLRSTGQIKISTALGRGLLLSKNESAVPQIAAVEKPRTTAQVEKPTEPIQTQLF